MHSLGVYVYYIYYVLLIPATIKFAFKAVSLKGLRTPIFFYVGGFLAFSSIGPFSDWVGNICRMHPETWTWLPFSGCYKIAVGVEKGRDHTVDLDASLNIWPKRFGNPIVLCLAVGRYWRRILKVFYIDTSLKTDCDKSARKEEDKFSTSRAPCKSSSREVLSPQLTIWQ